MVRNDRRLMISVVVVIAIVFGGALYYSLITKQNLVPESRPQAYSHKSPQAKRATFFHQVSKAIKDASKHD